MASAGTAARGPDRRRGALPTAPNALVGRDDELAALVRLLNEPATRLLTLTGPPGVGKTRLAVAAARAVAERFRDGVAFVDLTAIRDPALVPFELAAVLGMDAADDPSDLFARTRPSMHMLVVLDNFEHVIDAALALAGPLGVCPRLRLLVTSRERLHLHAEREVPVRPLALPDDATEPDRFATRPSVAMLLQGIHAFQPDFAVTAANRAALAEICIRLDGLPLALELAAARLRLFTPAELTFRLRHRMTLLTGGARDVPDRHRTLRAALAWSHNLLSSDEQALFRRLSVFVGGWTLEAAHAVCAADGGDDAVETMTSLVDKNLVRRTSRGELAEFTMLESLREFAADRLAEHGEVDAIRDRHARYYAGLAAGAESRIGTAEETTSLHRVGCEETNLRAALTYALAAGRVEWALPLASAVGWNCYVRGRLGEGQALLDRVLRGAAGRLWCCAARPEPRVEDAVLDNALAAAHLVAGVIAFGRGEHDRSAALLTRAGQRNTGKRREAIANAFLGHLARVRGDHDAAASRYDVAVALHGKLGNAAGVAWSRYDLGLLARCRGDLDRAAEHLWAGLERFREMDHPWAAGCAAWALATVELRRDRADEAAARLLEALECFEAVGDVRGMAQCLEAAAALVEPRDCESAGRLLGAAGSLRAQLAAPLPDEDRAAHDALAQRIRRALGPHATERARREGRDMPDAAAVAIAHAAVTEPVENPELPNPLTGREREVALLVARGRTNRQIGRALGIAEKTTEVHVHNIIRKLGACSRAEVAAWVASRGR